MRSATFLSLTAMRSARQVSKWFSAPHRRDVVVFDPPEFFWELSDRKPDGACFIYTSSYIYNDN